MGILFTSLDIYINSQSTNAFVFISKNNYKLYKKTDFINVWLL